MLTLLLTSLLTLPLFPLNPIEQDTVAAINLHITAGVNSPNRFGGVSPDAGIKNEWLVAHPFIVRAGIDYRLENVSSNLYPDGKLHGITISLETLYYRGTSELMAFIGLGPIVQFNRFDLTSEAADSLAAEHNITDVRVKPTIGYRINLGLRYHRAYTFELSVSHTRPKFIYTSRIEQGGFLERTDRTRVNNVRFIFGYVLRLRDL